MDKEPVKKAAKKPASHPAESKAAPAAKPKASPPSASLKPKSAHPVKPAVATTAGPLHLEQHPVQAVPPKMGKAGKPKPAPSSAASSAPAPQSPLYPVLNRENRAMFKHATEPAPLAGRAKAAPRLKKPAAHTPGAPARPAHAKASAPAASAPAPQGPPPDVFVATRPKLGKRYGKDRLVLLPRDPWWMFAYWDMSESTLNKGLAKVAGRPHRGVLRVYDVTGRVFTGHNAHHWREFEVHFDQPGHYLKTWEPYRTYMCELGLVDEAGEFFPMLRSNESFTPNPNISAESGEEWLDWKEVHEQLWRASWGSGQASRGSGEWNAGFSPSSPFGPWGISLENLSSSWGSGGFAAQTASLSSLNVSSFSLAANVSSFNLSSAGLSSWQLAASPSSPWGGAAREEMEGVVKALENPPRRRKFILWSKTELILYGGTEPDAKLTVAGHVIKLRPDGTFTLRFALPDGDLDLEVRADSADGEETRSMTHRVRKSTEG